MDPKIITAIIAGAAALGGAAIAALSSFVSTRHKLKELEVAASQKFRENILQNAREYTKAIYIPLTLSISRLHDAFGCLASDDSEQAIEEFRHAIDTFREDVQKLRDGGAEAFLTNELEDRLRSFTEFLGASRDASILTREAEIGFRIGFGGLSWSEQSSLVLEGLQAILWRSTPMSIRLPGIGVTYQATVIKAAPLRSNEFSVRFTTDAGEIRYLIKEVTLGGKPNSKGAN